MRDRLAAVCLAAALVSHAPASADILSTRFQRGETMDLTKVETIDWCVYRITDVAARSFGLGECSKGGAGIAAALSGPADHKDGIPGLPTRQELAAREAAKLGEIDFLKAATDFADCMLKYGRDRGYLQGGDDLSRKPPAEARDLSKADSPTPHAREIIRLLQWHRHTGDAAEQQGALQ